MTTVFDFFYIFILPIIIIIGINIVIKVFVQYLNVSIKRDDEKRKKVYLERKREMEEYLNSRQQL